jgi:LysM repeat protein
MVHIVQVGESTRSIAARYGIRPMDLVQANPDKPYQFHRNEPVFSELEEGEELVIPTDYERTSP